MVAGVCDQIHARRPSNLYPEPYSEWHASCPLDKATGPAPVRSARTAPSRVADLTYPARRWATFLCLAIISFVL
jgi:hypothetical protein